MDTPPDELVYSIEAIKNGIVALKESPDFRIERFTQAQIDNGEVIFIHKGTPHISSVLVRALTKTHGYKRRS